MSDRTKCAFKILLQVSVSAVFAIWLLSQGSLREQLRFATTRADWSWLLAAFFVYGTVELLGAIRWHFLLRAFGFHLTWGEATRILLIGIFFNTLLPGLIAGDVLRTVYLGRRFASQKVDAAMVVITERIFGLIGLVLLGASIMLWRYHWLHRSTVAGYLTDLALLMVACGAVASMLPVALRRWPIGRAFVQRIPSPFTATRPFHLDVRTIWVSIGTTLAAHVCYAGSFYCTGKAFGTLGITASFVDMLTVTPVVNTFTSLPISFAGIGVRESIFQVFLTELCGVSASVAVLIGSIGFGIRVLWAVLGCVFLACCGRLGWNEWITYIVQGRAAAATSPHRPEAEAVG